MTDLVTERCQVCENGAPPVSEQERKELLSQLPDWRIERREGVDQLTRAFRFNNFVEALAFTNRIGELAEEEGHHPAILTEWGRVTVSWWTHKIRGLHRNDFIMAARTDAQYAEVSSLAEIS